MTDNVKDPETELYETIFPLKELESSFATIADWPVVKNNPESMVKVVSVPITKLSKLIVSEDVPV